MATVTQRVLIYKDCLLFVFGFISLLVPQLSGWSEIVFPAIASLAALAYFVWPLMVLTAVVVLALSSVIAVVKKWSRFHKLLPLGLAVLLCVVWQFVYPFWPAKLTAGEDLIGVEARVSSFPVGGQTRILWAGGTEEVRNGALALLAVSSDVEGDIPSEVWPETIRRLGVTKVEVTEEISGLILYIPQADTFDPDTFGYFVQAGETSDSEALGARLFAQANGYRMWELDSGLFFFQVW